MYTDVQTISECIQKKLTDITLRKDGIRGLILHIKPF